MGDVSVRGRGTHPETGEPVEIAGSAALWCLCSFSVHIPG